MPWTISVMVAVALGLIVPFLWAQARIILPPAVLLTGLGWGLLNVRRNGDAASLLAVLLLASYPMVVYGFRPMYLMLNPSAFRGAGSYTDHGLDDPIATALVAALVGTISLFFGWQAQGGRPPHVGEGTDTIVLRRLHVLALVLVVAISSHLLLSPLGGLAGAIGSIRVARVELQGNLYPLVGLVGVTGVVLHALTVATRASRRRRARRVLHILGGLLVISVVPSLILGSRAFAFPPIIAALVIAFSHVRPTPKVAMKLAVGGVGLLAVVFLFGAAKNTADVALSGDLSAWATETVSGVDTADVIAQVDEFDFFVEAVEVREELPTRLDLLGRVVRFPLTLLPSSLGLPKPESYGLELRTAALGQVVPTGVPAGLIGELWLIGGLPLVTLGMAPTGWLLARTTTVLRSRDAARSTFAAVVIGHLPLLMARPLIVSLSRLLAFGAVLAVISKWPRLALVRSDTEARSLA